MKKKSDTACTNCGELVDDNKAHIAYSDNTKAHVSCKEVTLAPDEEWTPGARKNDSAKPDMSLMPLVAMEEAAKAFMVGANKYGRYNYTSGLEASRLVAAILRHTMAYMDGEETCPVDGQSHLGSVIACAAMILEQAKLGTLVDNRRRK